MNRYIENAKVGAPVLQSTRVLDQLRERILRERIRYLHYSLQTEKAYVYWARFSSGGMVAAARCGSHARPAIMLGFAGFAGAHGLPPP